MSILFTDIYTKAIGLFDDPAITAAYDTNKILFYKKMYTYLQNAIAMFDNPLSVSIRLSEYNVPEGIMETYLSDGSTLTFNIDSSIALDKENCNYSYLADGQYVEGSIDKDTRKVTFNCTALEAGKYYALEQYYVGEFTNDFSNLTKSNTGSAAVIGYIKDILARLLVKSWAEGERNLLLDIRGIMQDSDFKLVSQDRILRSKNEWIAELEEELYNYKNRLAWQIRFMNGSSMIGRG